MPETTAAPAANAPAVSQVDWEELKQSLGTSSIEETKQRAFEIAKFVADVENDQDSELILKKGGMQVALQLKK